MARFSVDWKGWVPVWVAVLAAVVAAALFIAGKADASDVTVVRQDVQQLKVEAAIERTKSAWRDTTLYEIAKRTGAIVPPPPGP